MTVNRPLFTKEYDDVNSFTPPRESAYIYGATDEPRSEFATLLQSRSDGVNFYKIENESQYSFSCRQTSEEDYSLRSYDSIQDLFQKIHHKTVFIDITGLLHSTWAALIKCALELQKSTRVVYLEPTSYLRTLEPKIGNIYDLSEKIEGISPLPMFSSFHDFPDENACFIPLLGFEGTRFSYMFETVQPEDRKIFPVIGVPGFRQEYPFSAYLGNAAPLQRSEAYTRVKFAKSNCPFSAYYRIEELSRNYPDHVIKLGLIGTKPHALGAILFAIKNQDRSEIIYDHVKRKLGRTEGLDKCLVYGVSEFMN